MNTLFSPLAHSY